MLCQRPGGRVADSTQLVVFTDGCACHCKYCTRKPPTRVDPYYAMVVGRNDCITLSFVRRDQENSRRLDAMRVVECDSSVLDSLCM